MRSVKSTKLYGAARANKHEVKRFIKFMVVGFSGLIVDFTILNILAHIFNVASWLAIAIAFVVAAVNNFIWNRLWVYPESRQHSLWKHFPTFLLVNAVGLGINELILFLFQHPMEALTGSAVLGLNFTKAIAAAIVMLWNFIVNRLVTFRDVKWQTNRAGPVDGVEEEPVASAL
jgi:putative flippase GtrA